MSDARPAGARPAATGALLRVEHLFKYYPVTAGLLKRKVAEVRAVDGVSFEVGNEETLALAGESGCGKTTVVRSISRLVDPDGGRVLLKTELLEEYRDAAGWLDLAALPAREMKAVRRDLQVIFQDPDSSLNPRFTIKNIVGEPLVVHGLGRRREIADRVDELLRLVGLDSSHLNRFPHELSGGQKQRVGIARALALEPRLILADEPVSALDMSIQGQILNLIEDLRARLGLTMLFIAHDLSVLAHISDRMGVMYLGNLVEVSATTDLFRKPLHPYSEALLTAIPQPDPKRKVERVILEGQVPSPLNKPAGCPFHPRCPYRQERCEGEVPELRTMGDGRMVACHFAGELELRGSLQSDVMGRLGLS